MRAAAVFLAVLVALGATCGIIAQDKTNPPARDSKSTVRVDVDMVVVPVTVVDGDGRYITGLAREHFKVWEEKVEQKIAEFSLDDAPMSLGILLDTSHSMSEELPAARRNAGECFEIGAQDDEYFLMLFADTVYVLSNLTTEFHQLQGRLRSVRPRGSTALNDAIFAGVSTLKQGRNPRKALVVVTDGNDNRSRTPKRKIIEAVKESDLLIYSMGNEASGLLVELTELSGGRNLPTFTGGDLQGICNEIVNDLKNQYVLAYKSTDLARDGNWRNIRVRVSPPPGMGRLSVRAKAGYYAPEAIN
jgi:Ca-activated chloride channel family protein